MKLLLIKPLPPGELNSAFNSLYTPGRLFNAAYDFSTEFQIRLLGLKQMPSKRKNMPLFLDEVNECFVEVPDESNVD